VNQCEKLGFDLMRILKHEIQSISEVLKKHVGEVSAELRLYGSRTDDQKRGGDI
jgi:hypothetical protein